MKKILIQNTSTLAHLLYTPNIHDAIKEQFPDSLIELITYEEFRRFAMSFEIFDQIHYIERKAVEVALADESNEFSISSDSWDAIYNLSNDLASILIATNLNASAKFGPHWADNGSLSLSNQWAKLLNALPQKWVNNQVPVQDILLQMCELKPTQNHTKHLTYKTQVQEAALENFRLIREQIGQSNKNVNLIGIVINGKEQMSHLSYAKLIDRVSQSANCYPIIIFNNNDLNKSMNDALNNEFNDSLLSISATYSNIGAIVSQLDAIVSNDLVITRIAEQESIPVVHVSANSRDLQYLFTRTNTIIIETDFQKPTQVRDLQQDISFAIDVCLNSNRETSHNSSNSIYISAKDNLGLYLSPLTVSINPIQSLRNMIIRNYTYSCMGQASIDVSEAILSKFSNEQIFEIINVEKEYIALLVKSILSAQEALSQNGATIDTIQTPIINIIKAGSRNPISSVPTCIFKQNIESTSCSSDQEELESLSAFLQDYKTNIKRLVSTLSTLFNKSKTRVSTRNHGTFFQGE